MSGISSVAGAAAAAAVRHAVNSITTAGITWKHDRDKLRYLFAEIGQSERIKTKKLRGRSQLTLKLSSHFFFC